MFLNGDSYGNCSHQRIDSIQSIVWEISSLHLRIFTKMQQRESLAWLGAIDFWQKHVEMKKNKINKILTALWIRLWWSQKFWDVCQTCFLICNENFWLHQRRIEKVLDILVQEKGFSWWCLFLTIPFLLLYFNIYNIYNYLN